jgi:hypothetical protein
LTLEDLSIYQHLTPEDMQNDPEWADATVLVATNLDRMNVTRMKCKLWAKKNKTYVFKWRSKTRKHINPADVEAMGHIRENNSFFWQYWVQDAPGFLSSTINGEMGLVNGSPVKMHSLTFQSQAEHTRIEQLLNGPNPPPFGSEIEVDIPIYVNMELISSLDNQVVTDRKQNQLNILSQHKLPGTESLVLPFEKCSRHDKYKTYFYKTPDLLQPYAKVDISDIFPYQLAFAMTIHKAQGRTIKKVLLDLHCHPNHYRRLNFASIFVALTRVQKREDLKLVAHNGYEFQQSYQYITDLKPHKNTMSYYHGFSNNDINGCTWDPDLALQFKPRD